ncbi:MAG: adenosylmethionine--8-amino-7-oxononanoate aminotransferase BioA [Cycloclasticus sp. symbiont of Bathymodiolus heckerae]|nr:MAG: adenosylmethionine--8-amino-7-oxononanoate aminotransferase BioA [Cycloclasticus sp. symbiont of Bathymodiolus heckerae]
MFDDWNARANFDKQHIWHPYTSLNHPTPVFPVASASGVRLRLADGRELIDGMSSWWAAIHGYNHPVLNAAIEEQLKSMSHVMFGGLTHQPAIDLAQTLINITYDDLQHVFFADSGSVSVEVAIKMAIQYWASQGQHQKQRLLTIKNGYHGDTFGAMAVCDPDNGMHHLFNDVLAKHLFAKSPNCGKQQAYDADAIDNFERLLKGNLNSIAAVILEPLVQGAGGMRFYSTAYLKKVRELCDEYNVLLILDEIATGFGRTGSLFAYEQANIAPDILCVGKALTGGYLSLSATLCSRKVANGIGSGQHPTLMHGPTFMANPLACAVANASLSLLLNSPWQQRINNIEKQLQQELAPCHTLSAVKDVRVKGGIGAIELHKPVDIHWMQPRFVELGVWVRPFSTLVYVMPPYIIEPADLSKVTSAMFQVVSEING